MMYGELAKQNASYQTGHNTGSLRACGYMQNRFDEIVRENPRKKKYTVQEISSLLSQMREECFALPFFLCFFLVCIL